MNYVLAIILPPLACLAEGRIFAFLINIILCLFGFFPGVLHALCVVHAGERARASEAQIERLIEALKQKAA